MRDRVQRSIDGAMANATSTMRYALNVVQDCDTAAGDATELAERLQAIAAQLYAVADIARDAERALAQIHAERRAAAL